MCFSAEASFIVGSSLFVVGVVTISKTRHKKDIYIALIPLLFSIQQITEGLLWIALENGNMPQAQFWLANIYGVFVGVIWPAYAPFAVYQGETSIRRKKIIALTVLIGMSLAAYTIVGLFNQPVLAEVVNNSIWYQHDIVGYQFVLILYLFATCLPFVVASYKYLYTAGIVITIGFFVAFLIYRETFASVWCFFAAIASALIYFYATKQIKKPIIPLPLGKNISTSFLSSKK